MTNWLAVIHRQLGEDVTGDARMLAAKIVDLLTTEEIVGLIAEEIEHQQRAVTRTQERSAFAMIANLDRSLTAAVPALPTGHEWNGLLRSRFKLHGHQVEWGLATIEQHEARLVQLRGLRDGLNVTIEFHERAIAMIREAGVECLDDIRHASIA